MRVPAKFVGSFVALSCLLGVTPLLPQSVEAAPARALTPQEFLEENIAKVKTASCYEVRSFLKVPRPICFKSQISETHGVKNFTDSSNTVTTVDFGYAMDADERAAAEANLWRQVADVLVERGRECHAFSGQTPLPTVSEDVPPEYREAVAYGLCGETPPGGAIVPGVPGMAERPSGSSLFFSS